MIYVIIVIKTVNRQYVTEFHRAEWVSCFNSLPSSHNSSMAGSHLNIVGIQVRAIYQNSRKTRQERKDARAVCSLP